MVLSGALIVKDKKICLKLQRSFYRMLNVQRPMEKIKHKFVRIKKFNLIRPGYLQTNLLLPGRYL